MRYLIALLLALSLLSPLSSTTASADSCSYVLGFKTLHDLIPTTVGACLVNEHHNADNGDGLQETTGATGAGGLLVWRKADNWTAYTDGYHTWINGPQGLQERLNTERFPWEADYLQFTPVPTVAPPPAPVVTPAPVIVPGNGATALCSDGTYSYSANHSGTCSHHGGVSVWYK